MKRTNSASAAGTAQQAERPDLTAWKMRHEVRRSNAAQPIPSNRQYRRTRKHRHRNDG
ncbi:hypothetical protein [Nocardia goodfellowii]|uniref:Uncharacterized protein n=1 Tax=Nocardia goodfellowii TaxID=882446 RepID=A0ABS4QPN7_9NOCA|nr:hypothetical protein [Nocardia goodfellowii]MBP2193660.1 hypothetical protein [Nocardia goodfellowii]